MNRGFWDNFKEPIIGLSPMDGVSDAPFRRIVAKYGKPSLIMTEFTSVEGLMYGAEKTLLNFIYHNSERPIAAQIYGKNIEAFYKACFVVCELGYDGIDINMGCPSKGVSGNGAGAALIKTPKHAQQIVKICQQAVKDWSEGKTMEQAKVHENIVNKVLEFQKKEPDIYCQNLPEFNNGQRKLLPISVKTRIGFDKPITKEWTKYLLEVKPVNLTFHGRTLKQMYTGLANWEEIAIAAQTAKGSGITVLGNGDINSLEQANQKIKDYGVDGVLIGRATFGNPTVFQGIDLNFEQKLKLALEHTVFYTQIFKTDFIEPLKKHLGWYCKGFDGAKELRLKLMQSKTPQEIKTSFNTKL